MKSWSFENVATSITNLSNNKKHIVTFNLKVFQCKCSWAAWNDYTDTFIFP